MSSSASHPYPTIVRLDPDPSSGAETSRPWWKSGPETLSPLEDATQSRCTCNGLGPGEGRFRGRYTLSEDSGDVNVLPTTVIKWQPSWRVCGSVPSGKHRYLDLLELSGMADGTHEIYHRVKAALETTLDEEGNLSRVLKGEVAVCEEERELDWAEVCEKMDGAGREAVLSMYPAPCAGLEEAGIARFEGTKTAKIDSEWLEPRSHQGFVIKTALNRVREALERPGTDEHVPEKMEQMTKFVKSVFRRYGPQRPSTITRAAWNDKIVSTCAATADAFATTFPDLTVCPNFKEPVPYDLGAQCSGSLVLVNLGVVGPSRIKPFHEATHLVTQVEVQSTWGSPYPLVSAVAPHPKFVAEMSDAGSVSGSDASSIA